MNHSIEELLELLRELPSDLASMIREDYKSIKQFESSGMMSRMYAESEYERLYQEALDLVERKKQNMKQAGVMLIVNQGLILAISRRNNKAIFGLPGGKFNSEPPDNDRDTKDTAIRETKEETSIEVKECSFIYERMEPAITPDGLDFYTRCYYATSWDGVPKNSEEGEVAWLTAEELTSTKAAFPVYNRNTLDVFKKLFPNVYLKGE